jgi:hypothetical protein
MPTTAGLLVKPKSPSVPTAPAAPTSKTPLDTAANKATGAEEDNPEQDQAKNPSTWSRVKDAVKKNWKVPGGDDSYGGAAKAIAGMFEGDVVPFKKKHDDEDWDDDSWIPSIEDFEQEEEIRNRKRKPANDINEMDKSPEANPYHGWGHSKGEVSRGPDKTATPITAKKAVKGAEKMLNKAFKKEVKEEQADEDLDANQKRVGQVGPTEKAKKISPILGKPQKEHPFNGKLVGAESKEIDSELARIMEIAGIKTN